MYKGVHKRHSTEHLGTSFGSRTGEQVQHNVGSIFITILTHPPMLSWGNSTGNHLLIHVSLSFYNKDSFPFVAIIHTHAHTSKQTLQRTIGRSLTYFAGNSWTSAHRRR